MNENRTFYAFCFPGSHHYRGALFITHYLNNWKRTPRSRLFPLADWDKSFSQDTDVSAIFRFSPTHCFARCINPSRRVNVGPSESVDERLFVQSDRSSLASDRISGLGYYVFIFVCISNAFLHNIHLVYDWGKISDAERGCLLVFAQKAFSLEHCTWKKNRCTKKHRM